LKRGDTLEWRDYSADGRSYDVRAVRSSRGGLQWAWLHCEGLTYTGRERGRFRWFREPAVKYPLYDRSRSANVRARGALGFEVVRDEAGAGTGAGTSPRQFRVWRTVTVPLYALVLLLGLAPAVSFGRRLRARARRNRGLCHRCGYDLRATPDRCPECGAVPGKSD
jgi:hypothetical protein